ncbi:MAG: threonine synthase [Candidatus Neomarinimicrobiota bacterium]
MKYPSYTGFRCVRCGNTYPVEPFRYQCDSCSSNLDIQYDYNGIKNAWSRNSLKNNKDRSLYRFLPLLPIDRQPDNRSIQVGGTPLVRMKEPLNNDRSYELYLKDDTRNPSGSLKDRATEIGLIHAKNLNYDKVIAASTGNAAASLAALSAFHGMQAVILTPKNAPLAKLVQILQYGATLIPIDGSYDDAFDLSIEAVKEFGFYSRNTGFNPIMSEGKKTVILEIMEQLNWKIPDRVYVPVGDGCIIGSVYKGLYDLLQLGWISKIPMIIAVQATGSMAIVNALDSSNNLEPVKSNTIADSIAVDFPRDGLKAIKAVHKSGGYGIAVEDDEILSAQKMLSSQSGIFSEPAAAAAFAGFIQDVEEGKINDGERIVTLITGTGLKDITAAQRKLVIPDPVKPDIKALKHVIQQISDLT